MTDEIPESSALAEIRAANPEELTGFTDPQTAEILWQLEVENKGNADKYDKDLFFQNLGTYRNDISFLDSIGRGASRGWYNISDGLDQADRHIRDVMPLGILDDVMANDEEYAQRFVDRDTARKKNSYSYEDLNRLMAITAEDASIGAMSSKIWDISLIGGLLTESLVQYAPALAASAVVGAATGGVAAPVMAAFLIQSGIVGSSAFHEYLKEEEGVVTKEDYLRVFNDPEAMNRAAIHGAKYGLPVAALDAFSLGIAGKIPQIAMGARRAAGAASRTDNLARTGKALNNAVAGKSKTAVAANKLKRWTPEVIAQGALGAGGELSGSYWAKGEVNWGEAFLEAILEPMMLPLELAAKSPKATAKALIRRRVKKMTPDEVKAALERKGQDTSRMTDEEAQSTLVDREGAIEGAATTTQARQQNRRDSQDKDYLDEHGLDMREDVFSLVELSDDELTSHSRKKADTEDWSQGLPKEKITLNAADLKGRAADLQDLGYIKEEGNGKYTLTRKALDEILSQPATETTAAQQPVKTKPVPTDSGSKTTIDGIELLKIDKTIFRHGPILIYKKGKKWLIAREDASEIEGFTTSFKSRKAAIKAAANLVSRFKIPGTDDQQTTAPETVTETDQTVVETATGEEAETEVKETVLYQAGDRVSHPKFGMGTVNRIIGETREGKLDITFDEEGNKKIQSAFITKEDQAQAPRVKSAGRYQEVVSSVISGLKNHFRNPKKGEDLSARSKARDIDAKYVEGRIAEALEAADENLSDAEKASEMENILKQIKYSLTHTAKGNKRKSLSKAETEILRILNGGLYTLNDSKSGMQVEGSAENRKVGEAGSAEAIVEASTDEAGIATTQVMFETTKDVIARIDQQETSEGPTETREEQEEYNRFSELNPDDIDLETAAIILGENFDAAYQGAQDRGVDPEQFVIAAARIKLIAHSKKLDLNAEEANTTADQVTQENYEAGDNTLRTLPPQDQLRLIQWIQDRVGHNIAVAFETVKAMTDTVRTLKNLPKNIMVQGYANPIDKVIVLALDRVYSQEIAGEEAFHIAARLLLTPEEMRVLNDYDWIAIAEENGIDVSQYPDDLQAWEALAKVAAKFLTGEKVVNIGPNNQKIMQRLKRFLNQLADYIRGKGWKKYYPSPKDIFISFDSGELADRSHNPYPLGPESKEFDLHAVEELEKKIDGVKKNLPAESAQLPGGKNRGIGLTQIAQGWAYLQEAFNHPNFYSAKNYLFRPVFKVMEEMREFQDALILEGLESFRIYAESSAATQAEADQFITLLDFLTTRNNYKPNIRVSEDGSMTFTMPTTLGAQGQDIQRKLNVLYPEGINGERVQLSQDEVKNDQGKITRPYKPVKFTISGKKDEQGVSPADAFNSFRQGADYQKKLLVQAITHLVADMPRGSTLEDLKERVRYLNYEIADSYAELDEKGEPIGDSPETKELIKQRALVNKAVEYIEELNRHPYWIPRVRQGERSIVVKRDDKVQHLEVYDQKKFESATAFENMLQERRAQVESEYPGGDVTVNDFTLGKLIASQLESKTGDFTVVSGLSSVEALLSELSHPDADTTRIDNVIKLIKQEIESKALSGVEETRQQQNISGHWRPDLKGYVNMATKKNLHTMSYQLGKVIYKPLIDNELNQMDTQYDQARESGDQVRASAIRRTKKYTKKYLDFVNDPKVRGALIRNVVFHTALGGRFSSAVLNLMQLPQALLPFLYSVNSDKFLVDSPYAVAKNTAIMARAFKHASRLAVKGGWGKLQTAYSMELEGAKPSYLTEGEWQLLRTLFGRGILSPVNLEDLTDKLSYQTMVRDASKAAIPMKALDKGADLSSWMFGSTEFLNRATTALAMYRIARDNEAVLNKMDQIRKQSHFKDSQAIGSMNLTNDEQGWANAAHIAVAETQFMMGKFNRPQLFYAGGALGPIFSQFMSFPFQYVEMMVKNIRRMATPGERAIGARMLSLMVISMVGMAGVFGLPFMENLRRFILTVSDTDLEKDLRKVLIDAIGPTYTNVIVGGSIFEYLGIESKMRAGVGTLVDSNIFRGDIGFIFGPLGGVIETAWSNVGAGIHEGDISKIARGLIPLGLARDVISTKLSFEEGYVTRSGAQLIAPQDILPSDYFITFLGFNPANRALARDKQAYARMARNSGQRKRDVVMKRVARLWRKSKDAPSAEDRREYRKEFQEEIREWNERARENNWPRITSQIMKLRFMQNLNPGRATLRRSPKHKRAELTEEFKMLEELSNN